MFDFEKFIVYKKAKLFHPGIIETRCIASLQGGSGRISKADRRNFLVIARSSIFECVAILDVLRDERLIHNSRFEAFYSDAEEISKMLFAMIRNTKTN